MRAVNLIPADQRGGAASARDARRQRLRGVRPARRAGDHGADLRRLRPSDLQPQVQVATLTARAQQAQAQRRRARPVHELRRDARTARPGGRPLVNSRFNWAQAFHEFGRVLPSNVSLTSLDGTVGSASPRLQLQLQRRGGLVGELGHPARERPHVHARRLHDQPGGVALTIERLRLIDGVSEVTLQSSTQSGSTGSPAPGRRRL